MAWSMLSSAVWWRSIISVDAAPSSSLMRDSSSSNSFLLSSFARCSSLVLLSISMITRSFSCAIRCSNFLLAAVMAVCFSVSKALKSVSIRRIFTACSASTVRCSRKSSWPRAWMSSPSIRSSALKYQSSSGSIWERTFSVLFRSDSPFILNFVLIESCAFRNHRCAIAFDAAFTFTTHLVACSLITSPSSFTPATFGFPFRSFRLRIFSAYRSISLRADGRGNSPPSFLLAASSHLDIIRPSLDSLTTTIGSKITSSSLSSSLMSPALAPRSAPGCRRFCSSIFFSISLIHRSQRVMNSAWVLK
mmetsp:Transcript_51702/g.70465  ORF Transcript_51702/g.70465 Transcript_51702/m.70465 type:complete len:305 (-) Transcript_51702:1358-2272(-)